MLGTIVQEDLVDRTFLEERTSGFDELRRVFTEVDVDASAREAGLDPRQVREVARAYAKTERACVRTDLGLEHSPNSTLNLYLAKLLYLLTGHFGKEGANNLHSFLVPLIGHSKDPGAGGVTTKVTGMREISKIFPPNILPAEIDNDHPERIRGVFVDSSNPLVTAADTQAYHRAFGKLELLVVVDVAMSETAKMAHWVLPASSQYEKWEATFFNLEFPRNFFHLRRPILEPLEGTLAEPEIYRRLVVAMGDFPKRLPLLSMAARLDRRLPKLRLFPAALAATLKLRPKLRGHLALLLHETLGSAISDGVPSGDARAVGVIWGACQFYAQRHGEAVRRAGIQDRGAGLGEALFAHVLESPSGAIISEHRYEDTWSFLRHADGKIHLAIPEMLAELRDPAPTSRDDEHPLILMAGERRSYNANTIIRESAWRKKDPEGALKLHPDDAASLGLSDGDRARCVSSRGEVDVAVAVTDEILPGVVSLPHGFGLEEPGEGESRTRRGPAINHLTDAAHCDAIAKTPFHKYIPVRIEPIPAGNRL